MDSGLGLIYAGMREKTHSASTQLKGTGTFEGTVTDLINLLGCGKRAQVNRGAINNRAKQKKAFTPGWILSLGLIFANCTWPAD